MKNPYEYDRTAPPLRSQATQRLMCRAWNECSASRDAEVSEHHVVIKNLRAALVAEHKKLTEQAEIVSELVGALREYIAYGGSTNTTRGRAAWQGAEAVLAKAKGE